MDLSSRLHSAIRDVQDFPKPGIIFKDITPILKDPILCQEVVNSLHSYYKSFPLDAIAGVESRGFLFGFPLAMALNIPFILIRKKGKLPYDKIEYSYELEYGTSAIEMHKDAVLPGHRVLIHDDLLATGGTAAAAAALIDQCGGIVAGFDFLISLDALGGKQTLSQFSAQIQAFVHY
jgi:adenine phosphoribosyltransferase